MQLAQQILFVLVAVIAIGFFIRRISRLRRNINLGRDVALSGSPAERWRNVMLFALGQKRMFRNPLVAVMHMVIYLGFIIINIEVLEIVLDGILGTHRLFAESLGSLYNVLINAFEFLAVGVIAVCVIFLLRRNLVRVPRLNHRDLRGWPRNDANYILIFEIILMLLFLTMNATDRALQLQGAEHYADLGSSFVFSGMLVPLFENVGTSTLIIMERSAWWLHILGIFFFLNYVTYSKHLHILFAFPNAYYMRLKPQGKMINMPEIQQEVLYAMQPETVPAEAAEAPKRFGARDIFDLSWRNLLDAYSCTECGRCSAACPATQTGKLLSPRSIMMYTRDRAEDVGDNISKNGEFVDDGKSLLHDYIEVEQLRACTSCQACVQECPVGIDPLEIILQLRRNLVMEESNAPQEWNAMFSNIENNFAPWKFSPEERDAWKQ